MMANVLRLRISVRQSPCKSYVTLQAIASDCQLMPGYSRIFRQIGNSKPAMVCNSLQWFLLPIVTIALPQFRPATGRLATFPAAVLHAARAESLLKGTGRKEAAGCQMIRLKVFSLKNELT